jgi:predicted GH43/DUF377 family glycosyl hydrolase
MPRRYDDNPLLTIKDIRPLSGEFELAGVFNPGACLIDDEVVLLLRVAEKPLYEKGFLSIPYFVKEKGITTPLVLRIKEDKVINLVDDDPRVLVINGTHYLKTISHIRTARSKDGLHFRVDEVPFILPSGDCDTYGIEDPRVTAIEGRYYIVYTSVSGRGISVSLSLSNDMRKSIPMGVILHPENKDACLFPERIRGEYALFHRPTVCFGRPSIWFSLSHDLVHWGLPELIVEPRGLPWESKKIGIGPEPLPTDKGWLVLYHAVGANDAYSLGLLLLDAENPNRVLKRSGTPFLSPETEYERNGFYKNIVFCNGWVRLQDGQIRLYYGAADSSVCCAETSLEEIFNHLGV